MQNRWFTYSFLAVIVMALVTLAVLQYRWLGSVSDAERQRLSESIEASTENFISDFNQVFSGLYNAFRIQITNKETIDEALETSLIENFEKWKASGSGYALVSEIYLIKEQDQARTIYRLKPDTQTLELMEANAELLAWFDRQSENHRSGNRASLSTLPDFGSPSYLKIPVQVLDFVSMENKNRDENLEVRLSIDQWDDFVLIRLNDEVIKEQLIPTIASRYLGESYQDQYHMSIVNTNANDSNYFNLGEGDFEPEFIKDLDRFNFTSLMMFEEDLTSGKEVSDSLVFNVFSTHSERIIRRSEDEAPPIIEGQDYSEIDIETSERSGVREVSSTLRDTSITTAFVGNIAPSSWKLWLAFKTGSLDDFVSKTRNRNLTISFGILLVLGISGLMIVIFAQRSRELAEQQMLFVAGVSHELRTPITVIRSAAENLSEGVVQSEERKKEYAHLMLNESKRLSEMVDQIMEFSGIQSGKRIYNVTDVSIDGLLEDILTEMKPFAAEKGMTIEYSNISKVPVFKADKDAIFLAVSNLIRNAIKFSDAGSVILFRVDESSYKSGLAIRIQVQDFGIGIPEGEQKKIFQPFYRAKYAVDEQVKGNGIGLSLVDRVVKAHNGEVSVVSSVGKGSTFTIIIPLHL